MPFSGFQDLEPVFAQSLQQMIAANPGISPYSGYRSVERQRELWNASDKTGHMVARPGHSQHNFRRAVDLHYADQATEEWAHAHAADYNLTFPMSWERWHIQPIGAAPAGGTPHELEHGKDTSLTDVLGTPPMDPMGAGPWGAGGNYDMGQYQRPLPFDEGFGPQQWMQGMIGGTLKSDLRAMMFKRVAGLFA